MALGDLRGGSQIALRHQVRVDVVVGDRAVLIGPGDAVDAEVPGRVVMAERAPQPRRLDEQRHGGLALELLIAGRPQVARHRGGDVRVDVKGGGSGRPVARAFLAADRPPGEGGTAQAERRSTLAGQLKRLLAPAQRVGGRARGSVGERRQHEALGVPEGVPVIPGAGQALGRDRSLLAAGAGLQGVKEREADRLLQLGVALELDIGAGPEVVQIGTLVGQQAVPAPVLGGRPGGGDLILQGGYRPLSRPSVAQQLDDPQGPSGGKIGCDHEADDVLVGLDARLQALRALEQMIHRRRHPQPGLPRAGWLTAGPPSLATSSDCTTGNSSSTGSTTYSIAATAR